MRRALIATSIAALAAGEGSAAIAQPARWRPVARVDAFAAAIDAAHLGAGITTDLAPYVRLDAVAAAGAARVRGVTVASGRGEIVGRFLVDPFQQSRWGPYVGAGLIVRLDEGERARGLMTVSLGAELPGEGGWVPAIELGYGGGVRVGVVLRAGRPGRR